MLRQAIQPSRVASPHVKALVRVEVPCRERLVARCREEQAARLVCLQGAHEALVAAECRLLVKGRETPNLDQAVSRRRNEARRSLTRVVRLQHRRRMGAAADDEVEFAGERTREQRDAELRARAVEVDV